MLKTNYVGRFKHLVDVNCSYDTKKPVLRASCATGTIEVLGSNAENSVTCHSVTSKETGWNDEVECSVSCEGRTECEDVYLDVGGKYYNGVFGEIYFSCTGDGVGARFVYEDVGDEKCGVVGGRNFRIAQLGAFCADAGAGGDFVYSGNYFECIGGVAIADDITIGIDEYVEGYVVWVSMI